MKNLIVGAFALAAAALLVFAPLSAEASGPYTGVGIDNSFPSCHSKHIPASTAAFGIVGVTGGSNYTQDPCAAQLASMFTSAQPVEPVSLYVNTGLYTGGSYFAQAMTTGGCASTDFSCGAYEDGQLAAQYAYDYATTNQKLGLTPTTWWLDVENTNTWDKNTALNTLEIKGEYDYLNTHVVAGSTIGIYAVPSQWAIIVGNSWSTSDAYPVWIANGMTTEAAATNYCTTEKGLTPGPITGGPIEIAQYVVSKQDYDIGC